MTASFEWYITFSVCSNSWYDLNARCILQTDGSLLNFTATFTGRQLYKFRLKHCLVWAAHTVSINKYTDRAQSCYVPPRPDLAFRLVGQVRFKVSLQVCLDVVEGRQRHRLSEREEQFYSAVSVVSLHCPSTHWRHVRDGSPDEVDALVAVHSTIELHEERHRPQVVRLVIVLSSRPQQRAL